MEGGARMSGFPAAVLLLGSTAANECEEEPLGAVQALPRPATCEGAGLQEAISSELDESG